MPNKGKGGPGKKSPAAPKLDAKNPNDPGHWVGLENITDDKDVAFAGFFATSEKQLETYESLSWQAIPADPQAVRADIGIWMGYLAYSYATAARAEIYATKARAVVKYTLGRFFPKFNTIAQADACAMKIVGYASRWKAVRDALEEKVRVGKKLLGDDKKEEGGGS